MARRPPGSAGGSPADRFDDCHRGWHSRRYLPHFDEGGLVQMVTYRLADALPDAPLVTVASLPDARLATPASLPDAKPVPPVTARASARPSSVPATREDSASSETAVSPSSLSDALR